MSKVVVVGCGAIGLTTALEIQRVLPHSAKVVIVTEKKSPHLTSNVAAGLWTPYSLQDTCLEKIRTWSKATYDHLLALWKKGSARESGVSMVHVLKLTCDPDYVVPTWLDLTLGHSPVESEKLEEFSVEMGVNFRCGYSYVAFVWEATKFLPVLEKTFLKQGGEIQIRKVDSLWELSDYDVIVNCTGLGARTLVSDLSTQPIRGQIVRVQAPWQHHCLMFDTKYVIPNQDAVVLGGTLQLDDYNLNPDSKDRNDILTACNTHLPAMTNAVILEDQVGLRPGRNTVRLEHEILRSEKDSLVSLDVVHNYGHGGSGITLSIGCAREAANLVKEAFGRRKLTHKL